MGKNYRECADIWSVGVLIFEMICGESPFNAECANDIYENIIKVKYTFPDFVSDDAKDLLSRIFIFNKSDRLTLEQIKKHKWLNCVF